MTGPRPDASNSCRKRSLNVTHCFVRPATKALSGRSRTGASTLCAIASRRPDRVRIAPLPGAFTSWGPSWTTVTSPPRRRLTHTAIQNADTAVVPSSTCTTSADRTCARCLQTWRAPSRAGEPPSAPTNSVTSTPRAPSSRAQELATCATPPAPGRIMRTRRIVNPSPVRRRRDGLTRMHPGQTGGRSCPPPRRERGPWHPIGSAAPLLEGTSRRPPTARLIDRAALEAAAHSIASAEGTSGGETTSRSGAV